MSACLVFKGRLSTESFSADQQASYAITIEATDAEFSTQVDFTITVTMILGIDDFENSVKVYPNPSRGFFTITLDRSWRAVEWKLYDLNGNLMETSQKLVQNSGASLVVDVSYLPSEQYLLKIVNEDRSMTRQIIITN